MSGDGPSEKMRWSTERRLEFIEFRLFWDGRVNRSDLVEFFGISVPQASADLGRYQEVADRNLVYDKRAKSYLVTPEFKPVLLELDAQRYLAQLRLIANDILPKQESWLGWMPPYATVPSIARRVDPLKLRKVLDVIRTGSAIHVEYQSLSRPDPLWRWLTPHALAFDGFRWHVRAWCHTRNRFQDFVFARMLSFGETKPDQINAEHDIEWQRFLTFRIGPHPDLETAKRKAIELDYGMHQGEISVETRISLSFYFMRRFGLDMDPNDVQPERQHIVLLNREEIDEAQQLARQETAMLTSEYIHKSEAQNDGV